MYKTHGKKDKYLEHWTGKEFVFALELEPGGCSSPDDGVLVGTFRKQRGKELESRLLVGVAQVL